MHCVEVLVLGDAHGGVLSRFLDGVLGEIPGEEVIVKSHVYNLHDVNVTIYFPVNRINALISDLNELYLRACYIPK